MKHEIIKKEQVQFKVKSVPFIYGREAWYSWRNGSQTCISVSRKNLYFTGSAPASYLVYADGKGIGALSVPNWLRVHWHPLEETCELIFDGSNPSFVSFEAENEWDSLKKYTRFLIEEGIIQSHESPPQWSHVPNFCPFGEQKLLANEKLEAGTNHQYFINDELVRIWAKEIKELNFGSITIEDWQIFSRPEWHGKNKKPTVMASRAVADPERFPHFRKLIDDLHAMGLKVYGWYVPTISTEESRTDLELMLSEYDLDGIKIDHTYNQEYPDTVWINWMEYFWKTAHQIKKDVVITSPSFNPFFAQYTDMIRSFDYYWNDTRGLFPNVLNEWHSSLIVGDLVGCSLETVGPDTCAWFISDEERIKYLEKMLEYDTVNIFIAPHRYSSFVNEKIRKWNEDCLTYPHKYLKTYQEREAELRVINNAERIKGGMAGYGKRDELEL